MLRFAKKKVRHMTPARVMTLGFLFLIFLGAVVLTFPFCYRDGNRTSFVDALFTSTSASCVTGLTIYDTYTIFSPFGQVVILVLIQIGGLGIMTLTTFFSLMISKKLGLRNMQVAGEALSHDSFSDMKKLLKTVIAFTFAVEAAGALLYSFYFIPEYGFLHGGAISGFLAISGYCNAGFDILGFKGPSSSFLSLNQNPYVLVLTMLLVIIGGLGFIVWNDLFNFRKNRKLLLHTKIVLMMSGILILSGAVLIFLCEQGNSLKDMPVGGKILNSFFQSVTSRSSGFDSIGQENLSAGGKLTTILLMFIGTAPGSTGGGIKITTFAVILFTMLSVLRGKNDTMIFGRTVKKQTVYKSFVLTFIALGAIIIASITTIMSSGVLNNLSHELDCIVESVSAFGTVGLTTGISNSTNTLGKAILSLTMFLGRVGPVSVGFSLTLKNRRTRSEVAPDAKIIVG